MWQILSRHLKQIGFARYILYFGIISIPLSNYISLVKWNADENPESLIVRPDYPVGGFIFFSGLVSLAVGPWFSRGSIGYRAFVFLFTIAVFIIYMVPMTILFVSTGVPFQD